MIEPVFKTNVENSIPDWLGEGVRRILINARFEIYVRYMRIIFFAVICGLSHIFRTEVIFSGCRFDRFNILNI
jgi:hypothetical protein